MAAKPDVFTPSHAWRFERYLAALQARFYAPSTLVHYRKTLINFAQHADAYGVADPEDVQGPLVESFLRALARRQVKRGEEEKPLCSGTMQHHMSAISSYFDWATGEDLVRVDPTAGLPPIRIPKRLPEVLTQEEVARMLRLPNVATAPGLRDKAFLEFVYSTGIRRSEAINLKLHDVDFEAGTATILRTKNGKDRLVPIGERALYWVLKYLEKARPYLTRTTDYGHLFVSYNGKKLNHSLVSKTVRQYLNSAGIRKPGCAHLLRHACATHMVQNGADMRDVQEILGHSSLDTTQIYVHVAIPELIEAHEKHHPSGGLAEEEAARIDAQRPRSSRKIAGPRRRRRC